ncbi:MAG: hypothetical protein Q8K02_11865, partial [Flavobacterium sp.]|nr:hypothetical protein [Flavobacterium sp.]
QGLTLEDWITKALSSLEAHNAVLDDWKGAGSACYLLASWSAENSFLGFGFWARVSRRAYLNGSNPNDQDSNDGCRSAVCIRN